MGQHSILNLNLWILSDLNDKWSSLCQVMTISAGAQNMELRVGGYWTCGDNIADVSPWASSQTSSALSLSLPSRSQHFHIDGNISKIIFYSKQSSKPIFCISEDLFCILWNCKQLYEIVRECIINFVQNCL